MANGLEGTGDKGYITSDGVIKTVAVEDREDPVSFEGEALDGDPLAVEDYRGKTVVVTVWGSWCAPCRKEAPWVVGAAEELGDDVQFVGINIRDGSTAQAQAFERRFGVDFPSFYSPDGAALLAFPGVLGLRTIPAFAVLDREGRVAASIIGQLPSRQTLVDLTQDVVDENRDG
jgi:thiol-disulfide isomerase/thioredoxin